jgi:hypothetical protein
MATWNALTDPLPRWDPKSQELAYNNFTDRIRVELPEPGDLAASGCIIVKQVSPTDQPLLKKRLTYNDQQDVATIKIAEVATASGAPCLLQTLTYNSNYDVDYIIESLSTW